MKTYSEFYEECKKDVMIKIDQKLQKCAFLTKKNNFYFKKFNSFNEKYILLDEEPISLTNFDKKILEDKLFRVALAEPIRHNIGEKALEKLLFFSEKEKLITNFQKFNSNTVRLDKLSGNMVFNKSKEKKFTKSIDFGLNSISNFKKINLGDCIFSFQKNTTYKGGHQDNVLEETQIFTETAIKNRGKFLILLDGEFWHGESGKNIKEVKKLIPSSYKNIIAGSANNLKELLECLKNN